MLRSREAELLAGAEQANHGAGPHPGRFAGALRGPHVAVIAEVKRRSPSKGVINASISAAWQAEAYARGGAAALSILTEPSEFGGAAEDLQDAAKSVRLPLLKKDFHVDSLQLLEARALGAAAVLLIARALAPAELSRLALEALAIGLEVLIEVRSEDELEEALAIDDAVIGVNSRDLETLVIDPAVPARLIPQIPTGRIAIAESGLASRADVERVAAYGANAALVGSALSAAPDPENALKGLTGVPATVRAR